MKTTLFRVSTCVLLSLLPLLSWSHDTVRVMYYNILWYPESDEDREDLYVDIIKEADPDILVVSEMKEEGVIPFMGKVISKLPNKPYSQAQWHFDDNSDIHLYYNAAKFNLIDQHFISADTRDVNEYRLQSVNDPEVTIYVLGAHLKASQGDENEVRRLAQCTSFRSHMNTHDDDQFILFGGDFNFYEASETGFQHLIGDGDDMLVDPIDQVGDWHNTASFSAIHTQSTRVEGFGGGGMDDRFDFILVSEPIMSETSDVRYVEGSYHAFGNSGNVFNKDINDPANTALPQPLLDALFEASDHIPVVLDLCIKCN